jgi:predicted ATPase
LHTGEADLRDSDYYGSAVNRCARLREAAHGGQTLLSAVAANLARDYLPPGGALRCLGTHQLRDLPAPEVIYELTNPELVAHFSPIRSVSAFPHNLPIQLTSFVGRERELSQIRHHLLRSTVRLLTLTGPAGTGKTRLALQVAEATLSEFANGVYFVALARVSAPDLLTSTIAEAVRIREVAGQRLGDTVKDALQSQQLLLILDNFEHVMDQASGVHELLSACPSLKVLVTSRELLHLSGEHVISVPPMELPDQRNGLSIEELGHFEALRLFIDRAQACDSEFMLTNENAPALAEICARLDGLPLAIELAAARVMVLTPQALLERLKLTYSKRQALLTATGGDRPLRHQALRNAIEWSYDLLKPWEQQLVARLSVFSGGFTLDAAEEICASNGGQTPEIFDGIASLLDKSLLRRQDAGNYQPRFRMFETIREFALERLRDLGQLERTQSLLAGFFVAQAERAEPELTGPEQVAWLDGLELEHDNIRQVLQWCNESARFDASLRLAGALWRFWSTRGYLAEGLRWLDATIASCTRMQTPALARALNGAANLAREQGDYDKAERLHQHSLAIFRQYADTRGIAEALNNLGLIAMYQAKLDAAQQRCEEGLSLFRGIDDKGGIAAALNNLANLARARGNSRLAADFHKESLALRRAIGDKRGVALSLNNLANVVLNQGDYGQATMLHQESLALRRELADRSGVATSLNNLGNVARAQGDYRAARNYYAESLTVRRELGDKRRVAAALNNLGILERDQGDRERAAALLRECLHLRRELGDSQGAEAALDNLRTLALGHADFASRAYHEESLVMRRAANDREGAVVALNNLGSIAFSQADYQAARAYYEEGLAVRRELGDKHRHDKRGAALTLDQLGRLALLQGNSQRAVTLLKQSLALYREVRDKRGTATALKHLGDVARAQGDAFAARPYYDDSLALFEQLNDRRNINQCLQSLTEVK